jgi:hypothetical protein
MKRQSAKREKVFTRHSSDRGLIPRIYKGHKKVDKKCQVIQSVNGQCYSTKAFQMKNKQPMKKQCSAPLAIREMEIETTEGVISLQSVWLSAGHNDQHRRGCGKEPLFTLV